MTTQALLNFSAGELSPKMQRSDATAYFAGLSTGENILIGNYGEAFNTPGSQFVNRTKYQDKAARLIPFIFSTDQSFILEFGHEYIRFFRESGSVVGTGVDITGATKADPCVLTCNTATLADGDTIDIYDVVGMEELNYRRFKVANKTSSTIELTDEDDNDIDSTGYTDFVSGSTQTGKLYEVYEITSPYDEADLELLKFTQQADVMYITHPDYAPRKLSRYASTNWTLTTITYDSLDIPPFLPINTTATTLTCSHTTGSSRTLTASAALFDDDHVGAYFRLDHGEDWGYVLITAVASTTSATCTVVKTLGNTTATDDWYEGAWSDYQGYPADVKFYEGRLYYVATTRKPLTVWGSQIEQYDNFEQGEEDTDSVSYTLGSSQVDKIQWAYPSDALNLGSAGGPFTFSSGSDTDPISPTNISVKQRNEHGAANISPVRIGPYVYYIERSGLVLGQFTYNLENNSYDTQNISYLSDHILESGVKEMALQNYPQNILWIVRNDGVIATLTREIKNEIKGWTRQVLSGTDATAESVAVIPNGQEDQVWLITSRTINEETRMYVEFIMPQTFDTKEDAWFVQCGLEYEGEEADTFSNLDHLEGETISVFADGAVHPDVVVENGEVELEYAVERAVFGLSYKATIKTVDLGQSGEQGTTQTRIGHISKVTVRLHRSLGCIVGDGTTQDTISFRTSAMAMGESPDLFTGDKEVMFPSGHVKNKYIVIEQEQPLPLMVLGLFPKMQVSN